MGLYFFLYQKASQPDFLIPDRSQITINSLFMRAYSLMVIKTCHRRGAHAMGGMAAHIPMKDNTEANAAALENVRLDKEREVFNGHDGTWVAHPGLVEIAMQVCDKSMVESNQMHRLRNDIDITAKDLLELPVGTITEEEVRKNIDVGIQYIEAWLRGSGCVPIYRRSCYRGNLAHSGVALDPSSRNYFN